MPAMVAMKIHFSHMSWRIAVLSCGSIFVPANVSLTASIRALRDPSSSP